MLVATVTIGNDVVGKDVRQIATTASFTRNTYAHTNCNEQLQKTLVKSFGNGCLRIQINDAWVLVSASNLPWCTVDGISLKHQGYPIFADNRRHRIEFGRSVLEIQVSQIGSTNVIYGGS